MAKTAGRFRHFKDGRIRKNCRMTIRSRLIEDAEVDGALVDWKEKGSTVEYLGAEDVDGTLAHKLKVTRKNGDISYVYLDPEHFLEIRVTTQRDGTRRAGRDRDRLERLREG